MDSELNMNLHIDKVTGSARSALNKMAILMKGRKGISVELGIKLYKTLVRLHLEHALASWAGLLNENQIKELEKVQAQCLRTVLGVFANSSTNALEVIANVTPLRLRMKELCIREFSRIISLNPQHPLRMALDAEEDYYNGKDGSPIGYLRFVSKELINALQLSKLEVRRYHCLNTYAVLNRREVNERKIFTIPMGSSKSRSEEQKKVAQEGVEQFLNGVSANTLVIFTDGSVKGEQCYGPGGCGIVMYRSGDENNIRTESYKVGKVAENVQCEVEGVVRALELTVEECEKDNNIKNCIILTDCKSAVDIICKQNNISKYWNEFMRMWEHFNKLDLLKARVEVIWVPI